MNKNYFKPTKNNKKQIKCTKNYKILFQTYELIRNKVKRLKLILWFYDIIFDVDKNQKNQALIFISKWGIITLKHP